MLTAYTENYLHRGRTDVPRLVMVRKEELKDRVRRLRLKQIREDGKPWSQDDLAHAAGVTRQHVYEVEGGRTGNLQAETARNYADALGVSVHYLLEGQHPQAPNEAEGIPLEVYLRSQKVANPDPTLTRVIEEMVDYMRQNDRKDEAG